MSSPFQPVRPGDLITSEFMNSILDALGGLDTRVKALEAAGSGGKAVIITNIFPAGPLQVGQEIQVRGRNFAVPANLNTVSIEGILIERFNSGSDDSTLQFNIPAIPSAQGITKDVILTVRNQNGAASTTFTLLPTQQIPRGHLAVTDETGSLGIIQVGGTFTLKYQLDSQTTIGETYRLSALFSTPVGTASMADWTNNTALVDGNGNALTSPLVKIEPGSPTHVGLKITVPTGATSINAALFAQSLNNDAELTTSSSTTALVVGSSPIVSDPRVTFITQQFGGASKGKLDTDGTIEIPFNGFAQVSVKAEFQVAGTFTYSAAMDPTPASMWTLSAPGPAQSTRAAGESELINVNVTLTANPDPQGGHPEQRFLVIKASRTDNDSIGHFDSFSRIPIRGYVSA